MPIVPIINDLVLTLGAAGSSYAQPVLQDTETGETYGPADLVTVEPFGTLPARELVRRVLALPGDGWDHEEMLTAHRFVAAAGPQNRP